MASDDDRTKEPALRERKADGAIEREGEEGF